MVGPKVGYGQMYPPGSGWRDLSPVRTWDGGGANSPGYATPLGSIQLPFFAPNKNDEVHSAFHMNHDYRADSPIYIHVHWMPATAAAGAVEFSVEWSFARMQQGTGPFTYDAFSAAATFTMLAQSSMVALSHCVVESSPFLPINLDTDGMILVRLSRRGGQGGDTYPDRAYFLGIDIHHEVGQIATFNRTRGDGWEF